MLPFSKGELVTRKSYNHDLLFRIIAIDNDLATLFGEDVRLAVDAPLDDLKHIKKQDLKRRRQISEDKEEFSFRLFRQDYRLMEQKRDYQASEGYNQSQYFQMPARVLHIDGDVNYLKKCIDLYKRMQIQVHGVHINEKEMPFKIESLIEKIQPQIIVITGHDSFSKQKGNPSDLNAYRHSKYFVETVRNARQLAPHLDELVIFAGACQSHFESLIRAGANFASSPSRVNIHALDPVYIAAKVAYTPFMEKVSVWDVLRNTLTREKGMGGIETRGLLRTGMPFLGEKNNVQSNHALNNHNKIK